MIPMCPVCLCMCVMSYQSTSKKHAIPSVNVMPCCMKKTKKVLLVLSYQGSTRLGPKYNKEK